MTAFLVLGLSTSFSFFGCGSGAPATTEPSATGRQTTAAKTVTEPNAEPPAPAIYPPLDNALARITKKPFGIYVSPGNSPVQPERFTGYHTGTDFETTPAEANANVYVSAACSGQVLVKQIVSGYGGVIVQACSIGGQAVTVLYGHLDIRPAFEPAAGQSVQAGTRIAILAPAYSYYSGGERKHLHLGIHVGTGIVYLGYVQDPSQLSDWLNAANYLK